MTSLFRSAAPHRPADPASRIPTDRRAGLRIARAGLAVCWGIATLAGPPAVRAQAGADCDPAGTQAQMNACAVRDFQRADIRLNIRYRETMEALGADRRVALRQEQRQWLRTRDPGCKAATRPYEGGTAWSLAYYGCLEQATRRRTGDIDRWAAGPRP